MNIFDDYTVRRPADFDYAAAIAELEEQVRRKKHLQTTLVYFEADAARLFDVAEKRRTDWALEVSDMERLQRLSPAVLLYTLTGRKEKMLAREEAEALAAAALYETAKSQWEYAERRAREIRAELRSLGNCERRLAEMVEEAKEHRRKQDAAFSEALAAEEARLRGLDYELTQLSEALDRGERARGIIQGIQNQLNQAHDLSVKDTFPIYHSTRDYLRDHAKYDHLDTAQALLDRLGQYLQEFAAELKDVELDLTDIPVSVEIGGGTRVVDLYLDNLFTDLAVRRRIEGSLSEMDTISERISPILEQLSAMKQAKIEERAAVEADMRRLLDRG